MPTPLAPISMRYAEQREDPMPHKLLLIDDDTELASLLKDFTARHGYTLEWADRPSAGYAKLKDKPDLILLDVMLPEEDGFAVCRQIRERGDKTPIIMLTARGAETDRISGLRIGADDYLPKPFNPNELLARVEAVLRRVPPRSDAARGLDPDTRAFRIEDREVSLTPSEYRLLETLTANPGRAFTRDQLLELLDEAGAIEAFDRAIDIHVSRLRSKIEADPKNPRHLLTVRGVGYRFEW